MVGGASCANANSEIELPLRGQIKVDAREELLLLIAQRIESGERTVCSIVFQAAGNFLREIVAYLDVRRKLDSLVDAGPMKRAVQRGIEGEIPRTDLLVDDWANFPSPSVGRECGSLVANLLG